MSNYTEVIHLHDGEWWFWDETWAHRHGPFHTISEAGAALRIYIDEHVDFEMSEAEQDMAADYSNEPEYFRQFDVT